MIKPKGARILVVEDDPGVLRLQQRTLEREGYQVGVAATAEAALLRLKEQSFDLILLDYQLPGDVTGLKFLAQLKEAGQEVPVIIVTGFSNEATVIWALRAGVRDFVTKSPEYLNYLPEAVGRVLKQVGIERQLVESEARFAAIINSAKDAIINVEADQRITLFNAAAEQMFRCRAADAIGQPLSRFIPKEFHSATSPPANDEDAASASLTHLVRSGNRGVRTNGEEFPLETSVSRVESSGRKFYTIIVRDITERRRAEEELRQRERSLAEAQKLAKIGSWEWDVTTDRVTWSQELYRIFGVDPQSFPGTFASVLERIHPEDRERVKEKIVSAGANGHTFTMEKRILRTDGRTRVLFSQGEVITNEQGKPRLMKGICQDITERKRTEEQLRILESAIQQETSSIVITSAELDPPGPQIVFVNPAFEKMTGYTFEEVLGKTPRILQGPKTDRRVLDELRAKLSHGEEFYGETVNYRKNGTELYLGWHINPIRDDTGRITHFVSVQRDITERKRTEERLREQAALLDKARDAIVLCDLEDKILFWNQGAERLYGWTAAEAVGKKAADLLYKNRTAELAAAQQAELEKGEWSGELRQVTKDGRDIIVESRRTLLSNGEGRPNTRLLINTDITEKKKLEVQYLRAQRLESIGTLAGGIAHDLNNVLTPIVMGLDLLKTPMSEGDRLGLLATLQSSASRGSDMVQQVLSFTRGVEGQRAPVLIKPLLKEVERIFRHTLPKSIEVELSIPDRLWLVLADPTQLTQVLMNLCVNARDAMPAGGRLRITAENVRLTGSESLGFGHAAPGPFLLIKVADTGTGIPAEIRDKIFDPFFTTKEAGKGTGLGLATVLGIVTSHGGFVNVYSEVGQGTQFSIYLPAADSGQAKQKEEAPVLPCGHGELVLVVDDEATIREIAKATLELHGYRTLTAGDGREAVALFAQHKSEIKAVLTDMMMPVMDGRATIRALRSMDPAVRVIAASGLADASKEQDKGSLGKSAFLAKPFTAEKLLQTVHEVLAQRDA
jgi:PAS domain S-box-containing protein